MALPPLVHYATVAEYRSHYDRVYCRGNILTFDGIRVYFAAVPRNASGGRGRYGTEAGWHAESQPRDLLSS